ncbi:MAG: FtsK/SpoIIIE domain-containing protein [Jiangellaceae bacterium]
MLIRLSVASAVCGPIDVAVTAPSRSPVSVVADALRTAVGSTGGLEVDGVPVADTAPLGFSPLVSGAIITAGPWDASNRPPGLLQARIVGGPDAGAVHHLGVGRFRIGRSAAAEIRVADAEVSRFHAEIEVRWDGVTVRDLGSENGTMLAARGVPGVPVAVPLGSDLRLGTSTILLTAPDSVPAATRAAGDGHVDVNRPPRLRPSVESAEVVLPAPPGAPELPRFPLAATLLPFALAAVLAVAWDVRYALVALLSPVLVGGQWLSDRLGGRRSECRERVEHEQALAAADQRIEAALVAELAALRASAPDLAQVLITASVPSIDLWCRRRSDSDALLVRLGTGDLPATLRVRAATMDGPVDQSTPRTLHGAPLTVSLKASGVLGLSGPRRSRMAVARSLAGQLAVAHSPRDLALVVLLSGAERAADWGWAHWLPHLAGAPVGSAAAALLGLDAAQVTARVGELLGLLADRQRTVTWSGPLVVVFLDGSRALRQLPGLAQLLAEGPAVGIHAIGLDEPAGLPLECGARAHIADDGSTLQLDVDQGPPLRGTADGASWQWTDRLARTLAPLRDLTPGPAGTPSGPVRLLDLLDTTDSRPSKPARADVAAGWEAAPRSTTALLGLAANGPFRIDLARDGPHVLVAGTTGSGKSELLQTLVTSLALANRPDELAFVLVDYKGGAAFADCARLPHAVGLVTDLDARLSRRALASLQAEIRRRERLLAASGVPSVERYQLAGHTAQLGRLVIVVDEYATLVDELPDFVDGLADVAQRGRSLGVHLVLATQRPGGVVSSDIRANTNLRIALRVTDPGDSVEVLDSVDAALISPRTPGRAWARRGQQSLVEFQTASVGSRPPRDGDDVRVEVHDWRTLAEPSPPNAADDDGPTDLVALVEAVRGAADLLGIEPPASPWLPPLPTTVEWTDLPPAIGPVQVSPIPYALADLPAEQARSTVCLDLETAGPLVVIGGSRSGRSTLLHTMAAGLASLTSCGDVHLYGIDGGGGSLLALAGLPHCGAVVGIDQAERIDRLVSRLTDEVGRRYAMLARSGSTDVATQRAHVSPAQRLPYLVLMVDGWDRLMSALDVVDDGHVADRLFRLARDGAAAGLRAVITAGRSGLAGRLPSVADRMLVLRLADPADAALAGLNPAELPDPMPPGRAIEVGAGIEMQVASPTPDAEGAGSTRPLRDLARDAAARDETVPTSRRSFRVSALPDHVAYDGAATALGDWRPLTMLIGVGGDEPAPLCLDLVAEGPAFVVAGEPRTGRSAALVVAGRSLLAGGAAVVAVAPVRSPLRDLPGTVGLVVDGDDEAGLRRLVEDTAGPCAVLVDDAELLVDTPVGQAVDHVLGSAADGGRAVVLAGTTDELTRSFHGFVAHARRNRTGLLLSPRSPLDGDLLGVRLRRTLVVPAPPGRGVLVTAGSTTAVQVAQP